MRYEKTLCDRVGIDYKEVIGQAVSILKHSAMHPTANIIADELDKLYLGIETGELEIIKFGRPMTEGEIEMIREAEKREKESEINVSKGNV